MIFKRETIRFKNKVIKEKKVKICLSMTCSSIDFFQNLIMHHKLERSPLVNKLLDDLFSETDSLVNEFSIFFTKYSDFSLFNKIVATAKYSLDFYITPSNLKKIDNFISKSQAQFCGVVAVLASMQKQSSRYRSYFFRVLFQFFYEKIFSNELQIVRNDISMLLSKKGYPIINSGIVSRGKYYFVVKDPAELTKDKPVNYWVEDDENTERKG